MLGEAAGKGQLTSLGPIGSVQFERFDNPELALGTNSDAITLDIALFAVPFGIIGGRIYHVLTHPDDYFFAGADLVKTLAHVAGITLPKADGQVRGEAFVPQMPVPPTP